MRRRTDAQRCENEISCSEARVAADLLSLTENVRRKFEFKIKRGQQGEAAAAFHSSDVGGIPLGLLLASVAFEAVAQVLSNGPMVAAA